MLFTSPPLQSGSMLPDCRSLTDIILRLPFHRYGEKNLLPMRPATSSPPPTCTLPHTAASTVLLPSPSAAAALLLLAHLHLGASQNCCDCRQPCAYQMSNFTRERASNIGKAVQFPSACRTPRGTCSSLTALARPTSCQIDAARAPLLLPLLPWLFVPLIADANRHSPSHSSDQLVTCRVTFSPIRQIIRQVLLFLTSASSSFFLTWSSLEATSISVQFVVSCPRPLQDAIALAALGSVHTLTRELSPKSSIVDCIPRPPADRLILGHRRTQRTRRLRSRPVLHTTVPSIIIIPPLVDFLTGPVAQSESTCTSICISSSHLHARIAHVIFSTSLKYLAAVFSLVQLPGDLFRGTLHV